MDDKPRPANPEIIKCELCLKEIPVSEAHVPEAEDYVVSFCGLECYDVWVKQADEQKGQAEPEKSEP